MSWAAEPAARPGASFEALASQERLRTRWVGLRPVFEGRLGSYIDPLFAGSALVLRKRRTFSAGRLM